MLLYYHSKHDGVLYDFKNYFSDVRYTFFKVKS